MPKSIREVAHDKEHKERQSFKDKVDSIINLSQDVPEENMHLGTQSVDFAKGAKVAGITAMQEGAVIDAPDKWGIRVYFKKGTMQKAIDNAPDDVVFKLDEAHIKENSSPFLGGLGEFTKKSMKAVEVQKGFNKLEVEVQMDQDHPIVQYYQKKGKDLSVSAEIRIVDWAIKMYEIDGEETSVFIVEEFNIEGLGIVGAPANVTSHKTLKFNKEDNMSDNKQDLEQEEVKNEAVEETKVEETTVTETEETKTEEVAVDNKVEEKASDTTADFAIQQFEALKTERDNLKVELEQEKANSLKLANQNKEYEQLEKSHAALQDYLAEEAGVVVAKDAESFAKIEADQNNEIAAAAAL